MPHIKPFLWFEKDAEKAVEFYLGIFKDGHRTGDKLIAGEVGPWKPGQVATLEFEIGGVTMIAFNGGPGHEFNETISMTVPCKDQTEIDYYWSALLAGGGSEIACGWLKDKFGVRWQVVPQNISKLVGNPGGMKAMMTMKKLIIADLEAAAQ